MKVAVINFSGNVGKTTVTRHLLAPRMPGAEVIAIESTNSGEGAGQAIRGRQFGDLQEYLQLVKDVIVDIGASNVEDLLALMEVYRGSHEDFDAFIVPTVPEIKQQHDTIATLAELARLGVPADKVRVLFNMVHHRSEMERAFEPVLAFLRQAPLARVSPECNMGMNEIYARVKGIDVDLAVLAADPTDYKRLIAASKDRAEQLALAARLANRRLALHVVPELDACFAALQLTERPSTQTHQTLETLETEVAARGTA